MDIISSFNPSDDDDDDVDGNMSEDSLSDDSFHRELAGTDGPITPPQQHRPVPSSPPAPPPPETETSPRPPSALPRMPLGAVHQYPIAGGNGSGGEGSGEVRADLATALAAPRTGGVGERKTVFRESEEDKTE